MTFRDPTSYTDLSQGKIEHIDFFIKVDFTTRVLEIEATYQFQSPVSGSLYLDSYKIDMKQVHANGRELTWKFDASDEVLGERLHLTGLDNDSDVTLVFSTSPEARALQWLEAPQTAGGKHPFLYSQCQASHARSIFPCQDTPSVRFTYSAEVEVNKALTAVMAAEQAAGGEGGGTFFFNMPQPIPSYLFGLAVGNLVFREFGPRTGVYAEPETIEAAAWEFAENEAKVTEAEKLLGPYLWGRYDVLILPPSFPFGGMENPRLTFLTPTSILGTRGQTTLITHELAHAWTGNLVTNATWQDFWLNEGWTTYAETRITEILEGKEATDLYLAHREAQLEKIMQRAGMNSPQTCLKVPGDGKDADSFTSVIGYSKGCFFLRECEIAVGRARFDVFIQNYMARYQFQSLTTEAFLDFMKAELPDVFTKVNVPEWIYEPGMPKNWNRPQSKLYDDVMDVLKAYGQGVRPMREQVQNWHSHQTLSFLQGLPERISVEDCRYFEDILDLEKKNDPAYYSSLFTVCVVSGDAEVLPRIEKYIEKIGRMYYIMPILRAMTESAQFRDQVRPMFERVRNRHHQITIGAVNGLLKKAGL